jgi:hypothetical protein
MATHSLEILDKAGIRQRLQLAAKDERGVPRSTGPQKVKFLEDKLIQVVDRDSGEKIPAVRYIFEQNGKEVEYDVPVKNKQGEVHYLVKAMAPVKEGETITLECQKSGQKSFINVTRGQDGSEDEPVYERDIDIDNIYGTNEPTDIG